MRKKTFVKHAQQAHSRYSNVRNDIKTADTKNSSGNVRLPKLEQYICPIVPCTTAHLYEEEVAAAVAAEHAQAPLGETVPAHTQTQAQAHFGKASQVQNPSRDKNAGMHRSGERGRSACYVTPDVT